MSLESKIGSYRLAHVPVITAEDSFAVLEVLRFGRAEGANEDS
jgi:hypothetical protein